MKLLAVLIPILSLVAQNLIRGTKKTPSLVGIDVCSMTWWSVYAVYIVICFATLLYSYFYLTKECNQRLELGYEFLEGDIIWTPSTAITMAIVAFIGGTCAAIVGVGGGIIYIPLMLYYHVNPLVAGATSLFMVMYSALSNVI